MRELNRPTDVDHAVRLKFVEAAFVGELLEVVKVANGFEREDGFVGIKVGEDGVYFETEDAKVT